METYITLIHPTRLRSKMAEKTFWNWHNKSDSKINIEYILSIDLDDISDYGWYPYTPLISDNKSAISAINNAAKAAKGNIIICLSDDFDCPPHWDTLLLQEIGDHTDFVLKTKDGIQPMLVTLPIVDRVWYERYGYIYHPEFRHMGSDVELTVVAAMTGRLIMSDLVFPHLHYSTGKSPKDAISEKNDLTYAHGDEVLARHRLSNFGIEKPIMEYPDIKWH